MKTSESIKNLATALLKAQGEFPVIPKNRTAKVPTKSGSSYTYKYADISDILQVIVPILNKHEIAFSQPHVVVDGRVWVTTHLMHSSGEWLQSDGLPLGEHMNPQETGIASTYMRRYDGCSTLGVVAEDDTDGNVASAHAGPQVVKNVVVAPVPSKPPATFDVTPQYGDASEPPMFDESGEVIEHPSAIKNREQKQARKANKPTAEERKAKGWISEGQEKRFWFFAKQNNLEAADVNQYCADLGITDISQLPWKKYSAAVVWAGGPAEERA